MKQAPDLKHNNEDLSLLVSGVLKALSQSVWSVGEVEPQIQTLVDQFGDDIYKMVLEQVFSFQISSEEAKSIWLNAMEKTRKIVSEKPIDFRAVCFDYILQNTQFFQKPFILERNQYQKLFQETLTDEVTGLYNIRFLEQSLDRELSRARRKGAACSLIFIDLDHFKTINDIYGHQTGNQLLMEVANRIIQLVRTSDLPCRYGGDEFAVLAPETAKEGATLFAERIRSEVEKIRLPGVKHHITASIGVATFPEHALSGNELINRADQALYVSKSRGKNRVTVYQRIGDQRRQQRVVTEMDGKFIDSSGGHQNFQARNLSRGGILMEVDRPVSLGSIVKVEMESEFEKTPISCVGSVVHLSKMKEDDRFEVGFSIVYMTLENEMKYKKLLHAYSKK